MPYKDAKSVDDVASLLRKGTRPSLQKFGENLSRLLQLWWSQDVPRRPTFQTIVDENPWDDLLLELMLKGEEGAMRMWKELGTVPLCLPFPRLSLYPLYPPPPPHPSLPVRFIVCICLRIQDEERKSHVTPKFVPWQRFLQGFLAYLHVEATEQQIKVSGSSPSFFGASVS